MVYLIIASNLILLIFKVDMSRKIYNFKSSILLSKSENDVIKYLIGPKRESNATTVVEVYFSKKGSWEKQFTGVICYIKDHYLHGFYFRLYSLENETLLWQQELYKNFQYISKLDFFHLFEGEDCIVGFNFTNKNEADYFRKQVQIRFPIARKVLERKPSKKSKSFRKKSIRRKTLTKDAISQPLNFQHLAHMPRNMNEKPFCINPALSEVFKKAGITEKNMKDDASRAVIAKIVEERGFSLEISKNNSNRLPTVPARRAPPPPTLNNSSFTLPRLSLQPNPPPNRIVSNRNLTIPKVKPVFVPSPVIRENSVSRENQVVEKFNDVPDVSNKSKIGSVAPLNLPRVNPLNKPPPPPDFNKFQEIMQTQVFYNREETYNGDSNNVNYEDSDGNGQGAFLESIRTGVTLKSPKRNQNETNDNSSDYDINTETDGRGAFLDSIRKGITLKPAKERVNMVANTKPISNNEEKQDLVSALKNALQNIDQANRYSSESEFDDDSDWSETDA